MTQQTQEIRRKSNSTLWFILVLCLLAMTLVSIASMVNQRTLRIELDEAKANVTKITAENNEIKALVTKLESSAKATDSAYVNRGRSEEEIDTEHDMAAKAKAAGEAALPTIGGTFAVVIGTLYNIDQRADEAAKIISAFGTCQHNGQPLTPCFVEVGNKSHTRFTTEVVAVPKTAMNEAEATALATCFNDNLPKLDSGEKVGAFASNLSLKRYAGKTCLTQ
jgi:hypothetical protein